MHFSRLRLRRIESIPASSGGSRGIFPRRTLGARAPLRLPWRRWFVGGLLAGACVSTGCGGDALVEMAAADAIESLAGQQRIAIAEYHAELARGDDSREAAAIAAFVRRVQQDVNDSGLLDSHAEAFGRALSRLRTDREVAWTRRTRADENTRELEQIAADLRSLAMQSLSLRDEWERYVQKLIEASRRRAAAPVPGAPAAEPAAATGALPP